MSTPAILAASAAAARPIASHESWALRRGGSVRIVLFAEDGTRAALVDDPAALTPEELAEIGQILAEPRYQPGYAAPARRGSGNELLAHLKKPTRAKP